MYRGAPALVSDEIPTGFTWEEDGLRLDNINATMMVELAQSDYCILGTRTNVTVGEILQPALNPSSGLAFEVWATIYGGWIGTENVPSRIASFSSGSSRSVERVIEACFQGAEEENLFFVRQKLRNFNGTSESFRYGKPLHIVAQIEAVNSNLNFTVYINGELVSAGIYPTSKPWTGAFDATRWITLGGSFPPDADLVPDPGRYLNIKYNYAALYSSAFSPVQVQDMYAKENRIWSRTEFGAFLCPQYPSTVAPCSCSSSTYRCTIQVSLPLPSCFSQSSSREMLLSLQEIFRLLLPWFSPET
jgi:hypothetical protein